MKDIKKIEKMELVKVDSQSYYFKEIGAAIGTILDIIFHKRIK